MKTRLKTLLIVFAVTPIGTNACEDLHLLVRELCEKNMIAESQCNIWLYDLYEGDRNDAIIFNEITRNRTEDE